MTGRAQPRNPLLVALDVPAREEAIRLARLLADEVGGLKVGLELFAAGGPATVREIAAYAEVFLDLKLHDIPTTVRRAAERIGRLGVSLVTVHALGGGEMVAAAVEGLAAGARKGGRPDARVVAVTVLSSLDDRALAQMGIAPVAEQLPRLATMAVQAGAAGVVCAPADVAAVRAAIGVEPLVVTPGVRPAGAEAHDHSRAASPAEAIAAGATHLVVGRPVTRADDPVMAARRILEEAARC